MATKKKPQTFKSFDEIDIDRVIITGNVNIVDNDPIVDTTKKGTAMTDKKKAEAVPAADVKPTTEEQKPQETKPAADVKKAEAKETKSEETNKTKGEEIMSKENENKEVKAETAATQVPAAPAAPSFKDDPELNKLLESIKDGKIEVEVKHKQTPAKTEFLRGLAWGSGIAIGVTVISLVANAFFGGGESSAE